MRNSSTLTTVVPPIAELLGLTKQALFDRAGSGLMHQSGGLVLNHDFELPDVVAATGVSLPSIETFLLSASDRSIMTLGMNDKVNAAWMPAITSMAEAVSTWLAEHNITLAADAFITASITPAHEVNGEAHFDDDQFGAGNGVGVFAIVGDLAGPKALTSPLPYPDVTAPHPLTVDDELKAAFAADAFDSVAFGANELVMFPQFGQLHSGPGPCGDETQYRHLLVFRGETKPSEDSEG